MSYGLGAAVAQQMAVQSGETAGFPGSYPYAKSSPLPSAILRPLQQPLYDTETLKAATAVSEVIFFQKQLGQSDSSGVIPAKTDANTNLQQPGQLANPVEFSVFGFVFEVACDVTIDDFVKVYKTSVFQFMYTGNRTYLMIPTTRIPQGVSPEGFAATTAAATTLSQVHNGVGHVSNTYKFTIGRSALRIRPTENFQIRLRWPNGAVTPTANTQTRVYILGLMWNAL